jgi:frataxin-like iron-binding protein CyaY
MRIQVVKLLAKISLLGAIVVVTMVGSAQAQSLAYRIRANIPFDFSIGDKKLSSGKYSIGRARTNSDDTTLSILDGDGRSKANTLSHAVQTLRSKDKTTLVFHRYGDQYFLYQVWIAGETTGREFSISRNERDIRRTTQSASTGKVAANVAVETVTIVGGLQ